MYMTIAGAVVVFSTCAVLGLTVFAHYAANECDPLASGLLKSPNQVKRVTIVFTRHNELHVSF